MVLGKSGYLHAKKMNISPHFTPYTKVNSKWVTDLNARAKTKLLQDNLEENLLDLEL